MTPDKMQKRSYSISEYDPSWIEKFQKIKEVLQSIFGEKAIAIEHVGSTSIPCLKAKPLIDVLVIVNNMEEFTAEKEK